VGVYFGRPGVEADDPYFGGAGPRRTGCISCGNCNNGCGHNAKNKLTTNYLYLAEKLGAKVHELNEVYELAPLDAGGFEVHTRHPGWAQRAAHVDHHTYTAEQVIVAAHAYGSAKLLHHMQHMGRLTGLSGQLGQRARTNSEQLLAVTRTHGEWERDREKIWLTPGSVSITSGVWPDPVTSIEPVYWGVGSDLFAFLVNQHHDGEQKHPTASWVKGLVEHPGGVLAFDDARHWSERTVIMLCSQTTDTSLELYWHEGRLRSRHGPGAAPAVHIPVVEQCGGRRWQLGRPGRPVSRRDRLPGHRCASRRGSCQKHVPLSSGPDRADPRIEVRRNTQIVGLHGRHTLASVEFTSGDGTGTLPCNGLFSFIGAEPASAWLSGWAALDDRGFVLTDRALAGAHLDGRWDALGRPPLPYETSCPGLFAAGDVRSGSTKRVAGAVGEGSAAVRSRLVGE
jgi:hypothetical protein